MSDIKQSAADLIGKTPLLQANNYAKKKGIEDAVILTKLEYLNPAGSVKDRIALAMIEDAEKTDAIREAFGNLHGAYSRKDENWREYLDKYNEVLMDTEKNYTKEMEKLHQKQFESLPEEKQYKGGRTVDELLQDMAEGKTLDDAETEYVKIFANLKDFEKAQQKAELKNDFSEDL